MGNSISRRRFLRAVGAGAMYSVLSRCVEGADEQVNMRPAYHITSYNEVAWPFDPNAAIYWKGRYHLMYIRKSPGGWGHVSSEDLIRWKRHPNAVIFDLSGNAFINKEGIPTIVSGHGGVSVAIAQDEDLNVWKFISIKKGPQFGDPHPSQFDLWDPHGWLEGDRYFAIFGCHPWRRPIPATVWKSTDLKRWHYIGPLLSREMPDVEPFEDISCPDFFKLGDKHMLLCISHIKGARYYLGEFRDEQFHPESHARMNWPGGACFAPETLLDHKGRRIMWAWATDSHRYPKRQLALGWAGTLTMPRVLSLASDSTLLIKPVEEYENLRQNLRKYENIAVDAGTEKLLKDISGDCLELMVEMAPGFNSRCGVKVRRSPQMQEQTVISCDPRKKLLRIDVEKSSLDREIVYHTYVQNYDGRHNTPPASANLPVTAQEAPFELKTGEPLQLRIFLDRTILEVFANDRQCLTQRIYPTRPDSIGVSLFSTDGSAEFTSLKAWDMAPIAVEPDSEGQQA